MLHAGTGRQCTAHCVNLMVHWWCEKWKMSRDDKAEIATAGCLCDSIHHICPSPFFYSPLFQVKIWPISGQCATPFTIHFVRFIFSFVVFLSLPFLVRLSSLLFYTPVWYYTYLHLASRMVEKGLARELTRSPHRSQMHFKMTEEITITIKLVWKIC